MARDNIPYSYLQSSLSPEEIARHNDLGLSQLASAGRVNESLIALYTFSEGRGTEVRDVSGYGPPLNLTLHPSSHFRWLEQGSGIEIIKPAILKTDGPAEKLFDALSASNELSIEVWMMPSNVLQRGPARIVSLSQDAVARNFTIGQDGADIDFRLRTPISGANGMVVNLRTHNKFLTLEKVHLVVTYKEGVERLYVNGREHAGNVDLKRADIIVAFSTPKNLLSQIAYSFVYFFPVSFFLSFVFSRRCGGFIVTLLLPVVIAISLLSMAEVLQAHLFARSVDWAFVGYGVVVVMAGALCGRFLAKKPPVPRQESPVSA